MELVYVPVSVVRFEFLCISFKHWLYLLKRKTLFLALNGTLGIPTRDTLNACVDLFEFFYNSLFCT